MCIFYRSALEEPSFSWGKSKFPVDGTLEIQVLNCIESFTQSSSYVSICVVTRSLEDKGWLSAAGQTRLRAHASRQPSNTPNLQPSVYGLFEEENEDPDLILMLIYFIIFP